MTILILGALVITGSTLAGGLAYVIWRLVERVRYR